MSAPSRPIPNRRHIPTSRSSGMRARFASFLTGAFALLVAAMPAQASTPLQMAIAPFLPEPELKEVYTPVAEYLSRRLGQPVELKLFPNYLSFWEATRGGSDFDVALDAAPVTDFRVQRQNWQVVARFDGEVTQSLVTRDDDLVLSPKELVNQRVAVQPSPSVGALVLYQLFPNPVQQPTLVFEQTNRDVATAVLEGKARAGVIPTPLVGGYAGLYPVVTTEPLPFLGFSVSPKVNERTRKALKQALLSFPETEEGQRILEEQSLTDIVPASNRYYAGKAELLIGTYGY
ncbi:phosphate/phosphite/phosphonate ABC transporter substrate-binding protein [Guyparkeria hydrothermalis]|uniref:phosphate/phosphite/phosphonate ABC transporter substrate-binding protein n=1 Tax=Guyparkeria hydrothermalis TaxID=923 RepID=UPI00202141B4|nr:PhnD/SsuA/transferrin family substrate-binding protein [Guyparkeria hydrothermalis]MCL7744797.1 phosphate/phosphite/phosphonate ABC transporter substrate-binding protein [Guyparkeria hydrothermalis]